MSDTEDQESDHLRKCKGHDKVIGAVRIAYQEEQGRFLVPEFIKLQLVIAHNLPELRYIKRGKPCAAGNQYAFGGFARDFLSRTFSSNSQKAHKEQGRESFCRLPALAIWLVCSSSHLPYFVFQHPFDLVAHGFGAGGAEMHTHLVGGLSNLPYQRRGVLFQLNGCCAGRIFNVHLHSSFLWVTRSPLLPFLLPPRFPLGNSFRQRG